MYSLIVTARLNNVDPRAWLADALRRTNDRNTSRKLAEAVKAANLSEELNKRADAILTRR